MALRSLSCFHIRTILRRRKEAGSSDIQPIKRVVRKKTKFWKLNTRSSVREDGVWGILFDFFLCFGFIELIMVSLSNSLTYFIISAFPSAKERFWQLGWRRKWCCWKSNTFSSRLVNYRMNFFNQPQLICFSQKAGNITLKFLSK